MEDWERDNAVDWDAPTQEARGTEYTVWKALLELEPCEAETGPKKPGAVTMLIDLQKCFEPVQLTVV